MLAAAHVMGWSGQRRIAMNRRGLSSGVACLLAGGLALGACARRAPIMASNADFQGSATLDQRADQIRRAATGRGWTMATQTPGVLRGTLKLRGHTAVVD